MVLVDSSVWIRFLYGQDPYAHRVRELVEADEAAGHELVYGELLIGDPGGRQAFLGRYSILSQAPLVSHAQVVELVRHRRLHGRGLSWIDVHLLAAALVSGFELWTADAPLAAVAREIGIAY